MRGEMMALGPFRFRVLGLPLDRLNHVSGARWAKLDRLAAEPAHQFIGPESDQVTLEATIYTAEQDGYATLRGLRAASKRPQPHLLVSGYGRVFGLFVIEQVVGDEAVFETGAAPLMVDFSITLSAFGGPAGGGIGGLFS